MSQTCDTETIVPHKWILSNNHLQLKAKLHEPISSMDF